MTFRRVLRKNNFDGRVYTTNGSDHRSDMAVTISIVSRLWRCGALAVPSATRLFFITVFYGVDTDTDWEINTREIVGLCSYVWFPHIHGWFVPFFHYQRSEHFPVETITYISVRRHGMYFAPMGRYFSESHWAYNLWLYVQRAR